MNDFEFNRMFEKLEKTAWRESVFENVHWYYCEEGLYAIRVDKGKPEERYILIKAKNPTQAISVAVMGMKRKE